MELNPAKTKLMVEIRENEDLTRLNSFGITAKAAYYCEIRSIKDLQELITDPVFRQNPFLILGGGSNILFTGDFKGLVIHPVLKGIDRIETKDPDQILIRAASGENWHGLVEYCVEQNLGGIENLALIPGNCGAAPIQNIGAYGRELADVLDCVDTIDLRNGNYKRFSAQECQLGYRDSIFKQPEGRFFFISSITLRLSTKNHIIESSYGALQSILPAKNSEQHTIADIYNAVVEIRKTKLPDPQITGNAGSFFKNPVINKDSLDALKSIHPEIPSYNTDNQHFKIPAAWLIEKAGWKGKQKGPVGIHALQALVIINSGGASGKQILDFSEDVKRDVKTKFGVTLEREVNAV